jgi:hypothetical protein
MQVELHRSVIDSHYSSFWWFVLHPAFPTQPLLEELFYPWVPNEQVIPKYQQFDRRTAVDASIDSKPG